jgi:hypothetical protein
MSAPAFQPLTLRTRASGLTLVAAIRGFTTQTLGCLALACLLVAAPAVAQINYAISGNTASVASGPGASGDIVIASTYNGYPVTSIAAEAFWHCSAVNVTIPSSVTGIGSEAFMNCTKVTNFTFLGNAPVLVPYPTNSFARWFFNVSAGAKAYYSCVTTGWGATYGGLPTVMLCPPQIAPGGAGVKPGGFGFTLTSLTNQTIVVEASTNLVNWQPIWTNTQPGTSAEFVDPEWLNHTNRFYRARSD